MRYLLAVIMLVFSIEASAQDSCVQALIQDKGRLDMRESSSLALAQLLRRTTNNNSNWGGNITVPIEGLPISTGASGAQQATEDYFSNTNIDWTAERLVSVATQTLSAAAVEAYRACLNSSKNGPQITVHSATANQVTLKIMWEAAPGVQSPVTPNIGLSGGRLQSLFPSKWNAGESFSRIVTRAPGEDLRVTADIGGQTDSAFVSYLPPAPTRVLTLLIGSCIGKGGQEGVRLWGPASERCNGLEAWGKYDAQVQSVRSLGYCVGKGGFEGVTLYGPVGEPCGGMTNNAWGTYISPVDVFALGISSCLGQGNILLGHRLWGPSGAPCGGLSVWGTYSEFNIKPK